VNFWPGSKRHVTLDAAREVLAVVPAGVLKVGVFVDAPVADVERHLDELELDRAQLHGDESPALFDRLDQRLIRVVRVRDAGIVRSRGRLVARALALRRVRRGLRRRRRARAVAADRGARAAAVPARRRADAENVAAPDRATRPDGVDVASGVESSARKKDPAKVAAFIAAARGAGRNLGVHRDGVPGDVAIEHPAQAAVCGPR
jgi:phosphoribosylanthranilate isomerase